MVAPSSLLADYWQIFIAINVAAMWNELFGFVFLSWKGEFLIIFLLHYSKKLEKLNVTFVYCDDYFCKVASGWRLNSAQPNPHNNRTKPTCCLSCLDYLFLRMDGYSAHTIKWKFL